jgi:hypothetical protein
MKLNLGYWWPFARTAWGWTVASASGVAALYYGPKKMWETFDWYMDRLFDHKVQDYLEKNVEITNIFRPNGGRDQISNPKSVSEIAEAVGYSEKRVLRCLKRLRRKDVVIRHGVDKWRANVPHLAPR